MKRGGGVHTVPAESKAGWWSKVDGEVVSRHRAKYSEGGPFLFLF